MMLFSMNSWTLCVCARHQGRCIVFKMINTMFLLRLRISRCCCSDNHSSRGRKHECWCQDLLFWTTLRELWTWAQSPFCDSVLKQTANLCECPNAGRRSVSTATFCSFVNVKHCPPSSPHLLAGKNIYVSTTPQKGHFYLNSAFFLEARAGKHHRCWKNA